MESLEKAISKGCVFEITRKEQVEAINYACTKLGISHRFEFSATKEFGGFIAPKLGYICDRKFFKDEGYDVVRAGDYSEDVNRILGLMTGSESRDEATTIEKLRNANAELLAVVSSQSRTIEEQSNIIKTLTEEKNGK